MLQEIALFYKKKKVLEWVSVSVGHELAGSFLLFRLHRFFLQMITNFSKRHKLHLLLTLLYIMDQDEVEVHKNAKRERGQYPAILTDLAWSIKQLLYGIKSSEKK